MGNHIIGMSLCVEFRRFVYSQMEDASGVLWLQTNVLMVTALASTVKLRDSDLGITIDRGDVNDRGY